MTDDGNYQTTAILTVETGKEKKISDKLVGVFFEDISYAADGGLYAEMVQNRDFEYSENDRREWTATTAWKSTGEMEVRTDAPLSKENPHYLVLRTESVTNSGWDGFAIKSGESYDFSLFARNIDGKKKTIKVRIGEGNTPLPKEKSKWQAPNGRATL